MRSRHGATPHVRTVRAMYDPEADVWVAESDDVPGLVTEADTYPELFAKLQVMIPELIELNEGPNGEVPVELITRMPQRDRCAA